MDAEEYVGCRNIGKEHHGYSDTHNVLHVVHNHKWRHLDSVGSVLHVRPGFSVSHPKQMVSHSPRNLQRGHLLVPRVVQSLLSGLQCRSLRGPPDHRIRRSIQQEHPGVAPKVVPNAPRTRQAGMNMPHDHNHQISNYNRAFAIGVMLNVIFVAIEAGYGVAAGSLALIADAGHNLTDVLSLLIAWGAALLATKPATEKRTYGFRKVTIMASLASAILLLVALGGITWEAIGRFFDQKPVEGMTVIVVAAIGVVINTITALLFVSGQKHDLNIRGAFLHMAADAGVSFGVVVAGVIIMVTGWLLVDPLISLLIVAVILVGTWSLLRDSMDLAIDSVPKGIDIAGIKRYLTSLETVSQIHDLHVWALSTTEVALSVHLIIDDDSSDDGFLPKLQEQLHDRFSIEHSTIQVERQDDGPCMLNKNGCI